MKNTIIAIVILLIAGGGIFLFVSNEDSSNETNNVNSGEVVQDTQADSQANTSADIDDYLAQAQGEGDIDATGESQVEIDIPGFEFNPVRLTVDVGTTVVWTNTDVVRHNVVSWSESPMQGLSSELLDNGESYTYTFDEPGEYVYFCEPHPFRMRGLVTVVE